MTGVSQLFVDTNILVYATDHTSPLHMAASDTLQMAHQQGTRLVISPQIIREYLSATTRPGNTALTRPLALSNVYRFLKTYRVVEEDKLVSEKLADLLAQVPANGSQIHDANIVATMLTYGIAHLLTHNTRDFARYIQLIATLPLNPAAP